MAPVGKYVRPEDRDQGGRGQDPDYPWIQPVYKEDLHTPTSVLEAFGTRDVSPDDLTWVHANAQRREYDRNSGERAEDAFHAALSPEQRILLERGIARIIPGEDASTDLASGLTFAATPPRFEIDEDLARLLPPEFFDDLYGFPSGSGGGISAFQRESLDLDRAALSGYDAGGQPTLGREAFEQDRISENYRNLLETAGLLGNLSGQRTLAGDVFDLDAELGRGRFDLDAELGRGRFGLEAELGRGGLDVERGGLDLARAQTAADFQSNPSNFIAAQLARGGLGSAVGDLLIPGRIAETLFGGNLGAPSTRALTASGRAGLSNNLTGVNAGAVPQGATIGGGLFGENLSIPSLQTLNQLNPEEIQAVGAAVPFLTGGNVTPTQYFSDAQRLGLTGFG